MSENLGQAILELDTRDQKFTQSVNKAEGLAQKLERQFAQVGEKISAAGKKLQTFGKNLTLGVTTPLVALGTAFVFAADKQIQAEARLGAAIRAAGGDVAKALPQFKQFASDLQLLTVIGDETTLAMAQVGLSMGLTEEQAKRAAKNAIALDSAFGINAASAIRYTAALEQGDTTMLNRYIPTLRNLEDQNDRVAAAQKILSDAFTLSITEAQKGLGPFRQLKNSLGDLFEQFGVLILDAINPFIQALRNVVLKLQAISPEIKGNILLWGGLAAAVGPVLLVFGSLIRVIGLAVAFAIPALLKLRNAFLFLLSPVVLVPVAIASAMAAVITFGATVINFARNFIKALQQELVAAFNNKIVIPFQQAVNDLISFLPTNIFESLRIEPLKVNDFIDNSFSADFKATMVQAKDDASDALNDLKRNAKKTMTDITGFFGGGIPDNLLADIEVPGLPQAQESFQEIIVTTQKLPDILREVKAETERLDTTFAQAGATFTSAFEEAILGGEKLRNVVGGLIKDLARLILRAAVLDPLSAALTGGIKSFFGRAHGGRVRAGEPVVVGEKRAEIFRPDSAGRIIPTVGSGGGDVILQIDASGADPSVPANLMRLVEARIIPQAIAGARQRVFSDLSRPEFA